MSERITRKHKIIGHGQYSIGPSMKEYNSSAYTEIVKNFCALGVQIDNHLTYALARILERGIYISEKIIETFIVDSKTSANTDMDNIYRHLSYRSAIIKFEAALGKDRTHPLNTLLDIINQEHKLPDNLCLVKIYRVKGKEEVVASLLGLESERESIA